MRWDLTTWKEKEEDIGWDNIRWDLFEARRKEMREALIKTRSLDLRWDKRPTDMTSSGLLLIFIISQCHYITWHENGKKTLHDAAWHERMAKLVCTEWGPGMPWRGLGFELLQRFSRFSRQLILGFTRGKSGFPAVLVIFQCLLANLSGSQNDVVQSTVPLPWDREASRVCHVGSFCLRVIWFLKTYGRSAMKRVDKFPLLLNTISAISISLTMVQCCWCPRKAHSDRSGLKALPALHKAVNFGRNSSQWHL